MSQLLSSKESPLPLLYQITTTLFSHGNLIRMHIRITATDLERARHAKAVIEKDHCRHHTYHDLAHLVGTNVTKLQASFRKLTGKNIYQYLTMIRVEKAMQLLETTELTIDAIACKVGLDRTNLNKQFKKLKGKSPSEWRHEQQEENKDSVSFGKTR